jgi:serine/threonine protein kinase
MSSIAVHSTKMTQNGSLVTAKIDWANLSGVILEGGCELKDPLELRDDAAKLRVRILGSGGRMGTAHFVALEPKEAADQLDIWQTLREVPHPNLNTPLAVGRLQVGGVDTVFAVLPDPDEKLATVVPERPLEWEEAAEVLQSAEKGLAHLHAYGLMHGSVSPETVQAVGYSIQLDTESVRRLGTKPRVEWSQPRYLAPESKEANLTTASDVWCLGATLFEVLAQEPYGSEGAQLDKGLPLGAVIARCLEKDPGQRCTLKEAPGFVEARPPAPPLIAEVKVQAPPAKVEVKTEEKPAAPSQPPPSYKESEKPYIEPAAPYRPPAGEARRAPRPVTPPLPSPPPPPARPVEHVAPGASAARATSGSRLPQPLTPKNAPRQITKEDMALVPMGKRHKKVQGKRLPIDARIRTLDGPSREAEEESASSSAPAVVARMLGVGTKSNFVRGIVAGVLLAVLFVAAIWLIIIPKLQSPTEPAVGAEAGQTGAPAVPAERSTAIPIPAGAEVTTSIPLPGDPSLPKSGSSRAASDALTLTENDTPRPRPQQFRVVLSVFDNQQEAFRKLMTLSQQHPDLLLHLVPPRRLDPDKRYLVVAGGLLSRSEAEELRQRITRKGLATARIEEFNR